MLAIIAIFIVTSMIISVLVIVATILLSPHNHAEDYCLTEENEMGQWWPDGPVGEASH
jgi:hypothetical protein